MHTREDEPRADVRPLDPPARRNGPALRNGPAVAALVLGVLGSVTSVVVIGGPFGVIGLVLGAVALRTARRTGTGRGMANAGVVLSLIAIAASVLAAVLLAWYADRTQPCYRPDGFRQYRECVQQQFHRG